MTEPTVPGTGGAPVPTLELVCEVVAVELGTRTVAASDRLVEDLGVESMDLVGIFAAIEDRWGIAVAEEELGEPRTVADVHALVVRNALVATGPATRRA